MFLISKYCVLMLKYKPQGCFFPRMLRYVSGRGGLGLLAVRRVCFQSRHAHTSPQSEYRPIKKVMVANRGENCSDSSAPDAFQRHYLINTV